MRQRLLAARRALDPDGRAGWDLAIAHHLLQWSQQHTLSELGVYWPLRGEPDLQAAYAALAQRGVALRLPVVLAPDAPLAFAAWQPGEAMVKDGMGVAVPQQLRLCPLPAALLVPCLGFNSGRYRLGYGGGYYDRTLAATPRPRTLGIGYACLAAEFAADVHDVALDQLLTEQGLR